MFHCFLFQCSNHKSRLEIKMTVKIISNSKENQKGKNCKILMLARFYWLVQENLPYLPVASRFNPSFPWCTAISLNPSHKSQCIQRSEWVRVCTFWRRSFGPTGKSEPWQSAHISSWIWHYYCGWKLLKRKLINPIFHLLNCKRIFRKQ